MIMVIIMRLFIYITTLLASLLLTLPVSAQEEVETLVVKLNRDFGYGGFGGEIQGRFSLQVTAPEDLVYVAYYLDGELVFESTEPPFRWQFNTASFSPGRHRFSAVGHKADGTVLHAREFERVFLTSEEAWRKTSQLLVPLLVIIGVVTAVGVGVSLLLGRKREHVPGVYGIAGGAICPRCGLPYSRHLLAPNMLVGKLERCPHCGKWAVVSAASAEQLAAAEARLAAKGQNAVKAHSEAEDLHQLLEESRFED